MTANLDKEREFVRCLLKWFESNKRDFPWRSESDPYRVFIAEKLLQQTDFGHVRKVYGKFIEKFPDAATLSGADAKDIEETIRPLGFHRQRSGQLKRAAKALLQKHGGKVPADRDSLLELDGVGNYIASAVMCFAFNKQVSVVDVNVRRVMRRLLGVEELSDTELESVLSKAMPKGKAKELNWGIIDFSGLICSRKPKCRKCFATDLCSYSSSIL